MGWGEKTAVKKKSPRRWCGRCSVILFHTRMVLVGIVSGGSVLFGLIFFRGLTVSTNPSARPSNAV